MLLSKTVIIKWHSANKKWYESKGYIFTKMKDEFKVKVEDLSKGSLAIVEVKCDCEDCKNPYLPPMKWTSYLKSVKNDEKYYCKKCALKLYGFKNLQKSKLKNGISFYDWCYQNLSKNEADSIMNRWDYELNKCSPKDIGHASLGIDKKGYWFKCDKNENHKSEQKSIPNFTSGRYGVINCHACNSFEEWCIENNRQDILDRWDYNLNDCKPIEIQYGTNKKFWFKCDKHKSHLSEKKAIVDFTMGSEGSMRCNQCNSFAQWGIDNLGEDFFDKYWSDKNILNPWKISYASKKKIWIKCQEKDYHEDYNITCTLFSTQKVRCPYCANMKVHPKDSLGQYIIDNYGQDFLDKIWSDKNKKSPFEYSPNNNKKVWWRCLDEKHGNYYREISNSNTSNFRCPNCLFYKGETKIENCLNKHSFVKQQKYNDLVGLGGKQLSYDFYLPYYNLLIEYNGEQHYKPIDYFGGEEQFKKQVEHDNRKRNYANTNNIILLEIPYWDYDNIEIILNNKLKL